MVAFEVQERPVSHANEGCGGRLQTGGGRERPEKAGGGGKRPVKKVMEQKCRRQPADVAAFLLWFNVLNI